MNNLTDRIQSLAADLQSRLADIRHTLHRHPEVSGEEVWTTQQLRYWLTEAGITVLDLPLKTGLVAEVRGALPGPTVALRTDIDALPVHEETNLPYASAIPGKMHACGHDFHMATILGAAFILQDLRAELRGTVRILCQPAEEVAAGAVQLIQAGALEGVSAVFGLHNKPDLSAGTVGIKAGPLMANVDTMEIDIEGKGGHGAIPDQTLDPVVAGSAVVMALQTAVSRSLSPLDPAVVSVCSFQAGSASNVIPMGARLLGTVRSFTPAVRSRLKDELLPRIVRDVAAGYGCEATLRFTEGTPAVHNDAAMAELVRQACDTMGVPVVEAVPTMGGEDFAEYQQLVPGCFVWMGTGCAYSWHHPQFTVNDQVLGQGAALFVQVALKALGH